MNFHDLLNDSARGDEQREGRSYGILTGKVTNTRDPEGLGRVKARIIFQGDSEETDWAIPLWPGAIEGVPLKDDPVLLFPLDGDPNRLAWCWYPGSNTQNRPTEAIPLGTTWIGMMNYFATQYNQLRADFNSFVTGTYNVHTHAVTGTANLMTGAVVGTAAATADTGSPTSAATASKGKAADGSTVADKSSSEIVLSGRAKVGK